MSKCVGAAAASILVLVGLPLAAARAQQLTPNAYAPSPVGVNIAIFSDNYSTGDVSVDPSLPVEGVHATINSFGVGYGRTLGWLGRYTNIGFVVPYVHADVHGQYLGAYRSVRPTGFGDPQMRFAVNLYGAPAMTPREFSTYRPATILGVSLTVVAPYGDYDNTKVLNIGSNRWSFKPELGFSRTNGSWTWEADAGGWLFTDNTDFAGGKVRSQDPIGALQLHVTYTFRSHLWLAVDGTYYTGGRTTINGQQNIDLQKNSRVGVTLALPLARWHSIKIAYSRGARTTIGGDFETIGLSYQYAWLDR